MSIFEFPFVHCFSIRLELRFAWSFSFAVSDGPLLEPEFARSVFVVLLFLNFHLFIAFRSGSSFGSHGPFEFPFVCCSFDQARASVRMVPLNFHSFVSLRSRSSFGSHGLFLSLRVTHLCLSPSLRGLSS